MKRLMRRVVEIAIITKMVYLVLMLRWELHREKVAAKNKSL